VTFWDAATDDQLLAAVLELRNKIAPYVAISQIDPGPINPGERATISICGIVKPPPRTSHALPAAHSTPAMHQRARTLRGVLHEQAEAAIGAAEELGFQHVKHPEVTIGGTIMRADASPVPHLVPQAEIRLWLEIPRT